MKGSAIRSLLLSTSVFFASYGTILAQQTPALTPASSASHLSEKDLRSRGFSLDSRERPMCAIEGTEGSCRVEAFVFSEKTRDAFSYSCAKLNKSTYIGRCVRGNLEGMAVIVADGTQKSSKEAFLSYFLKGRMAYPAISSYVNGDLNFGVQELNSSYGCVYFGNWDKTQDRCRRFIDIYGEDFFTEANAEKLRDGSFDLTLYGAKFFDYFRHPK